MKTLMKILLNFPRVEKEEFLYKVNRVLVQVYNVCEISFNIKIILQFDREDYQVHQYAGIYPY